MKSTGCVRNSKNWHVFVGGRFDLDLHLDKVKACESFEDHLFIEYCNHGNSNASYQWESNRLLYDFQGHRVH